MISLYCIECRSLESAGKSTMQVCEGVAEGADCRLLLGLSFRSGLTPWASWTPISPLNKE